MKPVTAATPCTTPAHAPAPARRAVATCAPVASMVVMAGVLIYNHLTR